MYDTTAAPRYCKIQGNHRINEFFHVLWEYPFVRCACMSVSGFTLMDSWIGREKELNKIIPNLRHLSTLAIALFLLHALKVHAA
jgi:hypothetical protein